MSKRFFALLVVMVLALSALSGCGSSDEGNASGKVQAFLDENSKELEEQVAALSSTLGEGGGVTLSGVGDEEMVYIFKLGEDMVVDGMETTLKDTLATLAPVFEPMADSLKDQLGVNKMRITVKYVDINDKELASESFDSK